MYHVDYKAKTGFYLHLLAHKTRDKAALKLIIYVDLHMRYINLQGILQRKVDELERLCLQELQLLEGKWKTHSLPLRKKLPKYTNKDPMIISHSSYLEQRMRSSSEEIEDATYKHQTIPTLVLAYRYLEPQWRYKLRPSVSYESGNLFIYDNYCGYDNHFVAKSPNIPKQITKKILNTDFYEQKMKKHPGNFCNLCIKPSNNADNISLDAYDLASSCCDSQCIPKNGRIIKRRNNYKPNSKCEETQTDPLPDSSHLFSTLHTSQNLSSKTESQKRYEAVGSHTLNSKLVCWKSAHDISPKYNSNKNYNEGSTEYLLHDKQDYENESLKPRSWDNLSIKMVDGCNLEYENMGSPTQSFNFKGNCPNLLKSTTKVDVPLIFTGPSVYLPSTSNDVKYTKSAENLVCSSDSISTSFQNIESVSPSYNLYQKLMKKTPCKKQNITNNEHKSNKKISNVSSLCTTNMEATRL